MIKITKAFKYAYDGYRVKEIAQGAELPEDDQAAVWAVKNDHAEKAKKAAKGKAK